MHDHRQQLQLAIGRQERGLGLGGVRHEAQREVRMACLAPRNGEHTTILSIALQAHKLVIAAFAPVPQHGMYAYFRPLTRSYVLSVYGCCGAHATHLQIEFAEEFAVLHELRVPRHVSVQNALHDVLARRGPLLAFQPCVAV